MKSHIGICMTIGRVTTDTSSCKLKLITKISTETELVGIDDAMGQVLCTFLFLAEKGVFVPTHHRSRQEKYKFSVGKWMAVQQYTDTPHQCQILLL